MHYLKHETMVSEDQRLDNRDKAIIEFIKVHDGPTENEIVKALREQKISSKLTTLKKIRELKQKGEIKDSLKEGESGFHHLYINEDKSEFNQINEKLLQIEIVINRMNSIVKNIKKATLSTSQTMSNKYTPEMLEANLFFLDIIYDAFDSMLHLLLRTTTENIRSQIDSKILYNKIIDLLGKVQSGYTIELKLNNMLNARFGKIKISDWIESLGIDDNLFHDIIQATKSIEEEFLTKTAQKDPHEKSS